MEKTPSFADGQIAAIAKVNKLIIVTNKVYAELFLTPSSDLWLGLAPDDVYSAIDHDGVNRRD
ncbi:MAG: hypothetical protein C4323_24815 [Mastigocladus sp. ERB_26_2]